MSDYYVNQYDYLDGIEYKVLEYLILNNEELWKLLKYSDSEALLKNNLSIDEKRELIYTGNGNSEDYRAFIEPYLDDSFQKECGMIRIYMDTIFPETHLTGTVNICIDVVCHNKISNIYSDDNIVPIKNRATTMVKNVIKSLNGQYVNGVGELIFSRQFSLSDKVVLGIWNNRNFYGYTVVMSTRMSSLGDKTCG